MNKEMNEKAKVVAFYLPQYHTIPENDEWWGKGFTEWTNVKAAKPLFEKHNQPRVPQNKNYYDLSTNKPFYEQAKFAKENGVDGFCFYHYWFNGSKLLHRPIENFINDKNIEIDFCLSWANEPWTRAWDGGDKEVLMAQEYGDYEDWKLHIDYLINFFRDPRYIKIDGKPVFLIYRTESFERFDEMIKFWNKTLIAHGLQELYFIETMTSFQSEPVCNISNGVLEFEPMHTIAFYNNFFDKLMFKLKLLFKIETLSVKNYSTVWKRIIKRDNIDKYNNKKTYLCGFVDWDNTPRKKERGLVFKNGNPLLFGKFFSQLVHKNVSELIFINAWNEWAEGTYLEPDEKYGDSYIKKINKAMNK